MTQPAIHKVKTSAELVALVEAVAGIRLRNCIAVMPFWQTRSNGAFRVALPPEVFDDDDVSSARSIARQIGSTALAALARFTGSDGLALVVYTDAAYPVADCALTPLIEQLLDQFSNAGYAIKNAALVSGDGWSTLFDGKGERPLDEIRVAAQSLPPLPAVADRETLPAPDPELTRNVTQMLLERLELDAECDGFGIVRRCPLPDPAALLDELLSRDPQTVGALEIARLLALLQSADATDGAVLHIAFGRTVDGQAEEGTLRSRDERLRRLTGHTDARPDPVRLAAAATLLSRAVANCVLPERSWAMCALAWVRWALGLTNAAAHLVDAAARVDPLNAAAPVYQALIAARPPNWIFGDRPPVRRSDRRAAARLARRDALVAVLREED